MPSQESIFPDSSRLVILSRLDRVCPAEEDRVTIIGMEGIDPTITKRLTCRHAGIVVPVLVAVGDPAIRLGEPDNLWRELEEAFESAPGRDTPSFEVRRCRSDGEQNDAE